jgi:hypothetical protein
MSDCPEKQKEVLINARESRGLKNKAKAKTAIRDMLKRPRLQRASHILGTSHRAFTLFVQKKNCFWRSRTSFSKLPSVNGRNVFTENCRT